MATTAEDAASTALEQAGITITDLTSAEVAAVQRIVSDALYAGWTQAKTAQRIGQVVGLTARQANAVIAFRLQALKDGKTDKQADDLATKYATRLKKLRARTIADYEVRRAIADAQRAEWAQQQHDGLISKRAVRVFKTHKDERTCPTCRPLNGRRQSLRSSSNTPPLHPRCRCTEVLMDEGLKKGALVYDEAVIKDRVRTPAGSRHFRLPIGAPIIEHPDFDTPDTVRMKLGYTPWKQGDQITHLYRGVSQADLERIRRDGLIDSNFKGIDTYQEAGLVFADIDPGGAPFRVLQKRGGVILKIDVRRGWGSRGPGRFVLKDAKASDIVATLTIKPQVEKLAHVRTPAGARRYKAPIGAPIVDRTVLQDLERTKAGEKLLELLREQGGATVHPGPGLPPFLHGYSVAVAPRASGVKLWTKTTPQAIDAWIAKNKHYLAHDNTGIGVWHDTESGKVWFDVVKVFKDRDKAIETGRKYNQIAIFDLDRMEEIPTGGTGLVTKAMGDRLHFYLFQSDATAEDIILTVSKAPESPSNALGDDFVHKARPQRKVRHVATPAGVKRFKAPIGSPIGYLVDDIDLIFDKEDISPFENGWGNFPKPINYNAPDYDPSWGNGPDHMAAQRWVEDSSHQRIVAAQRTGDDSELNSRDKFAIQYIAKQMKPSTKPAAFYRGVAFKEKLKVGDVIEDRGWSSVAPGARSAVGFALGRADSPAAAPWLRALMTHKIPGAEAQLLKVLIPKGTPGVSVFDKDGLGERIVGAGRYRVTKVRGDLVVVKWEPFDE